LLGGVESRSGPGLGDPTLNPLIPHWFGPKPAQVREFLSQRNMEHQELR
jgi:hypothetical protein